MDLLCFFSVLRLLCLYPRLFICALWSTAGKGLASWLSFVESNCECHFPFGILGQVWYLIVSIPDLCTLTHFLIHLHLLDPSGVLKTIAFQARVSTPPSGSSRC